MGRPWMSFAVLVCVWAVAQTITSTPAQAQLDPNYYTSTCPQVFPIMASHMLSAIQNDSRISASLVRLHFHDCFVQGCDGSVLLDGADGVTEKTQPANNNSLRGFDVIDNFKAAIEAACPGVVSCADIVALGSFFGIVLAGGPVWAIPLGRKDALAPNASLTLTNLAPPFGDLTTLLNLWAIQGFAEKELVSLSGAHTIGDVRCVTMKDPNGLQSKNPQLNATRQAFFDNLCAGVSNTDNANELASGMDVSTPTVFDNSYYLQFPTNNEVFTSDLALLNSTTTKNLVTTYQQNQTQFFVDFAASMIKMGNLNASAAPLLQVRKNCRVVNPTSNLRMPGQQSRREMPRQAPKELTQEEEEQYIQNIRDLVAKAADDFMAENLGKEPVASDKLYSSS